MGIIGLPQIPVYHILVQFRIAHDLQTVRIINQISSAFFKFFRNAFIVRIQKGGRICKGFDIVIIRLHPDHIFQIAVSLRIKLITALIQFIVL